MCLGLLALTVAPMFTGGPPMKHVTHQWHDDDNYDDDYDGDDNDNDGRLDTLWISFD